MDGRRVLRLLRTSTLVLGVIICGLLVALWVRSYWSFDVFRGRLSTTTGVQCASTNGRLILVAFSTGGSWGLTWGSITDASMEQDLAFARLQKAHQTLLYFI